MTGLIISPNEDSISTIENMIKDNVSGHIITANSGNEARRIISQNYPDLVVIDAPLPDEFGQELAITLSEFTNVILICRNDIYESC